MTLIITLEMLNKRLSHYGQTVLRLPFLKLQNVSSNSMYRKLTSEAGLYNNVYNDIDGNYDNEKIEGLYSKHPRRRSFHFVSTLCKSHADM